MPGPGLDLIGEEEFAGLAEVADALRTRHRARLGRDDDPTVGAS